MCCRQRTCKQTHDILTHRAASHKRCPNLPRLHRQSKDLPVVTGSDWTPRERGVAPRPASRAPLRGRSDNPRGDSTYLCLQLRARYLDSMCTQASQQTCIFVFNCTIGFMKRPSRRWTLPALQHAGASRVIDAAPRPRRRRRRRRRESPLKNW